MIVYRQSISAIRFGQLLDFFVVFEKGFSYVILTKLLRCWIQIFFSRLPKNIFIKSDFSALVPTINKGKVFDNKRVIRFGHKFNALNISTKKRKYFDTEK